MPILIIALLVLFVAVILQERRIRKIQAKQEAMLKYNAPLSGIWRTKASDPF